MKKILLLLLLVFTGCANSLYQEAETVDLVYLNSLKYQSLVIEDAKSNTDTPVSDITFSVVRTNAEFKDWTLAEIKKRHVIIDKGLIERVWIVGQLYWKEAGQQIELNGLCYKKEIWIATSAASRKTIKMTLDHEIGHIIEDLLTDDQYDEWYKLYMDKLDSVGLSIPLGMKYTEATSAQIRPFPTSYALKNFHEYFAVIYEYYYLWGPKIFKGLYPREYRLIEEHKIP